MVSLAVHVDNCLAMICLLTSIISAPTTSTCAPPQLQSQPWLEIQPSQWHTSLHHLTPHHSITPQHTSSHPIPSHHHTPAHITAMEPPPEELQWHIPLWFHRGATEWDHEPVWLMLDTHLAPPQDAQSMYTDLLFTPQWMLPTMRPELRVILSKILEHGETMGQMGVYTPIFPYWLCDGLPPVRDVHTFFQSAWRQAYIRTASCLNIVCPKVVLKPCLTQISYCTGHSERQNGVMLKDPWGDVQGYGCQHVRGRDHTL